MHACVCVCMYVTCDGVSATTAFSSISFMCVYACMYACMHVCVYACMYVTCDGVSATTAFSSISFMLRVALDCPGAAGTCMYERVYIYVCMWPFYLTWGSWRAHVCIYVSIYVYTVCYVCACLCVCIYEVVRVSKN